ncbi:hypothetical protein [Streptomyces sp. S1D4-20]|uniref:hypothetical protein n=1 Tax=Streptomyces sp. S1D4-20 TaxID=2594462 RepID=UPI001163867A|nr:hypothetical protein [Streptomyces sp. S1D4-20]QDN54189.1 hypothetical protein FNV67_01055 [Streptomyces sp. S1D4-20]
MAALPLTAPMHWLRPGPDAAGRRRQLLALRPLGDPDFGGRLRLTDLARLEDCTEQKRDRWCEEAFAVLTAHLKSARTQAVQEHGGKLDPPERARLTDSRPSLYTGEETYHWYSEPAWVP